MNKQELIEKFNEEIEEVKINTRWKGHLKHYEKGKKSGLRYGKLLAEKLDETELPVIPQLVANFIEKEKNKSIPLILYGAYLEARRIPEVFKWVWENDKNHNAFAVAYITGNYKIEKQPPKTRQVLVKFFDSQEYRTELTEDAARYLIYLIKFLEANKNE